MRCTMNHEPPPAVATGSTADGRLVYNKGRQLVFNISKLASASHQDHQDDVHTNSTSYLWLEADALML